MNSEQPYSLNERSALQAHYDTQRDKASYDAFIRYGHDLLERIGADPYHVRMALTKGYSMMEFGNRAAYQHKEKDEGVELGLLIRAADLSQVQEQYKRFQHDFKPTGNMAFIHPLVPRWEDLPTRLLELHEAAMREEYERIKGTTLVEQRKGSGTDNNALRYAIVNGVSISELPGPLGLIMVNITWNSLDWKGPSEDKSNHGYVKEGNVPMESWNFDFDNPRNTPTHVHGFWQHVGTPRLHGSNNLVIFHSAGEVVGFYGQAEILPQLKELSDGKKANLVAPKALAVVLKNKLKKAKEKGYLEDKQRMGQNGFIYLAKPETAEKMLHEAWIYNPENRDKLDPLREWVKAQTSQPILTKANTTEPMSIPLNRIYYGPPGTGKTHHTIEAALEVCDPAYLAANKEDREALRKRFNDLLVKDLKKAEGQIAFCTFHQSYSYEDFVEGIKPVEIEEDAVQTLRYHTRPGILKEMARRAMSKLSSDGPKHSNKVSFTPEQYDRAEVFKLSLGDSQNPEDQLIYDYCIKNNCVAIGFMEQHDLTGKSEQDVRSLPLQPGQSTYHSKAMNFFSQYLNEGDIVVVTKGLYVVRAIGIVTGPYRYDPKSPIGYPHFRDVKWLMVDAEVPYEELYTRQFSQQSIYKMKKSDLKRDFFVQSSAKSTEPEEAKNFVLIIDEINRGNVAGIFGELITLIEENKRKGRPEALEVTLPYSQEPFSIPDNLYIIGTMNTADRSVEALDAALRRRFSFVPMMPEADKLKKLQSTRIDINALLQRMNERVVQLLDEDHQIGHSHFWDLHKEADPIPALRRVFADKIIPQLEEYFHRDRSKLRLVLGATFVESVPAPAYLFLGDVDDIDFEPRATYRITPQDQWTEEAFRAIHG